jgi:hypothetical protein
MMSVDRRILDFWEAYDRIEPLPDTWAQSAQVCTQLEKIATYILATNGQEYTPTPYKDFMPARWEEPPKPVPRKQSAEEVAAELDRAFDR